MNRVHKLDGIWWKESWTELMRFDAASNVTRKSLWLLFRISGRYAGEEVEKNAINCFILLFCENCGADKFTGTVTLKLHNPVGTTYFRSKVIFLL